MENIDEGESDESEVTLTLHETYFKHFMLNLKPEIHERLIAGDFSPEEILSLARDAHLAGVYELFSTITGPLAEVSVEAEAGTAALNKMGNEMQPCMVDMINRITNEKIDKYGNSIKDTTPVKLFALNMVTDGTTIRGTHTYEGLLNIMDEAQEFIDSELIYNLEVGEKYTPYNTAIIIKRVEDV